MTIDREVLRLMPKDDPAADYLYTLMQAAVRTFWAKPTGILRSKTEGEPT